MSVLVILFVRLGLALLLFRLLGLPIARLALPGMPAASYALAGPIGLVIATHACWLMAHAGTPIGRVSIGLSMLFLAGLAGLALRVLWGRGVRVRPTLRDVVVHHLAFALMFALALAITARNPAVDPDSERFMDYAMYNGILASRSLPLQDPWLAGERVSYYDYGYFAAAYLALWSGLPDPFFLVAIALLPAALFAGLLAVGRDLGGGLAGGLAAWFVCLGGNLDAARQTVTSLFADPWPALDWFRAGRVLAGGNITEFPYFTLLWGDLHPYAMVLPLWPIMLAVTWMVATGMTTRATVAVAATTFAAVVATHTWDAVPLGVLLLGFTAVVGWRHRDAGGGAVVAHLRPAATVLAGGVVLALPYLVAAPTGGRGLGIVTSPSTLGELATAWGIPVAILIAAALVEIARRGGCVPASLPAGLLAVGLGCMVLDSPGISLGIGLIVACIALCVENAPAPATTSTRPFGASRRSLAWGMAAVGLGLVVGVELLFVDDHYSGDLERMNTVFKAYMEAWVLLSGAAGLLLADVATAASRSPGRGRRVATVGLVASALGLTAIYPLRATPARAGNLLEPQTLDPRSALFRLHPEDGLLVAAVRRLPYGVLLEATGDPYSWNGRIASFTGFPAVVGWGHHEAGWRNSWTEVEARARDVERAYETESLAEALAILADYDVRYVVVGGLERKRFAAPGLAKFTPLEAVVQAGTSVVYRVGGGGGA